MKNSNSKILLNLSQTTTRRQVDYSKVPNKVNSLSNINYKPKYFKPFKEDSQSSVLAKLRSKRTESKIEIQQELKKNYDFLIKDLKFTKLQKKSNKSAKAKTPVRPNIFLTERVQTYKVKFDAKLEDRKGVKSIHEPILIKTIAYQSGIIIDNLLVLIDDLTTFRSKCLTSFNIKGIFNLLEPKKQISLNKLFEQVISYSVAGSKLILLDFVAYIDKFISVKPPSDLLMGDRTVTNETSALKQNLNLLDIVSKYLQGVLEVYKIIISSVDNVALKVGEFKEAEQFLSQARFKTSLLSCTIEAHSRNQIMDTQVEP